jgi:hypothetical protein
LRWGMVRVCLNFLNPNLLCGGSGGRLIKIDRDWDSRWLRRDGALSEAESSDSCDRDLWVDWDRERELPQSNYRLSESPSILAVRSGLITSRSSSRGPLSLSLPQKEIHVLGSVESAISPPLSAAMYPQDSNLTI